MDYSRVMILWSFCSSMVLYLSFHLVYSFLALSKLTSSILYFSLTILTSCSSWTILLLAFSSSFNFPAILLSMEELDRLLTLLYLCKNQVYNFFRSQFLILKIYLSSSSIFPISSSFSFLMVVFSLKIFSFYLVISSFSVYRCSFLLGIMLLPSSSRAMSQLISFLSAVIQLNFSSNMSRRNRMIQTSSYIFYISWGGTQKLICYRNELTLFLNFFSCWLRLKWS